MLHVGQSVETPSDQRRRLALADGSILYLNRDTAITLTAAREVTLRRGEIYVEVAQDPAAARFIVSTPRRQMIALGTKFDVRVAPEGTELQVTQGKVQVSDVQLPVLAGQQLTLDGHAEGPPDISAAPCATHTIEWIRELMAAAQSPLVPGSKHSGGSLVAVDPQGQETRLSLRKYHVDVHIEDGFARTTIDQTYFNDTIGPPGGHVLFPAAARRLAVAPGDVRQWPAHGRGHGRTAARPRGLRVDRLPHEGPGPLGMGRRQHVQDAGLSAGGPAGKTDHPQLHATPAFALWPQ